MSEVPTAAASMPPSAGMRGAVALNNMGLTLLGRNQHRDAMATLKDALDLIGSQCSKTRARERLTLDEQGAFLDKANKSVAQSSTSKPTEAALSPPHRTLSLSSSNEEVTAAIYSLPSCQAGFSFHIEFDDSETDGDLISAITLLNLSVACRRFAKTKRKGEKRSRLMERAYQCAFLSHTILSRILDDFNDHARFEQAVTISIFVLHELVQLGSQLGHVEESRQHYLEQCDRRYVWTRMQDAQLPMSHSLTTAPAA
jgi:hypothetical protein